MSDGVRFKVMTPEDYLALTQADVNRALKQVIERFDFSKAAAALRGFHWRYQGAAYPPSAADLKKVAKDLLMRCMQSGADCSIHQGPLTVSTRCFGTPEVVTVELTLTPVFATAVYIDSRAVVAKHYRKFTSMSAPAKAKAPKPAPKKKGKK